MSRSNPPEPGRGNFKHAVLAVWSLFVLVPACHDSGESGNGARCEVDGECRSGFCWAGCREPEADEDGDGLSNSLERELGLSPVHRDTDGDGLLDKDEVGDPERPRDTDGDGVIDALESRVADSDGDCLPDELDPNDTAATPTELAYALCRGEGVCAGRVTARCEGGLAVCDYTQIIGYETVETRCDGRDNDCDGQTDEGLVYLESTGALKVLGEPCVGLGECRSAVGEVECGPDGGVVCSVDRDGSERAGALEDLDCDGLDNDCDGRTDEGVSWVEPDTGLVKRYGAACRARGVCGLGPGRVECSASGRGICSTEPGGSADLSGPERCDGLDEDCDGLTDEGLFFVDPSGGPPLLVGESCGRGACAGTTVACAGGVAVCPGLAAATPETCNGTDDDCDGLTDEAADVGLGCSGLGVCAGREVVAGCEGLELLCRYRFEDGVRAAPERDTTCDGLDEDCDGQTDEDLVAAGGGKKGDACLGSGLCATVQGFLICAGGGLVCSADAGLAEVCDGVDNDCDGETDEDASGAPTCGGLGVCANASRSPVCEGGEWACPYEDLAEFREVEAPGQDCDGLDNDCDGLVDEGSALWPAANIEELAWAPPSTLMASAEGQGAVWVHGGLVGTDTSDALWRFAGRWERVVALNAGPARAGHAAAFESATGVFVVQGGFAQADGRVTPLGPDGPPVFSMWAFDPAVARWGEVENVLEGFVGNQGSGVPVTAERILQRRHHTLVALGDGRLVLHGGLANEGAPEALVGTLSRSEAGLVCRWSPLIGPGWRAGHRGAALELGGQRWLVLAGGLPLGPDGTIGRTGDGAAGEGGGAGWAVFSLDELVTTFVADGPVGELGVGLVPAAGGLVSLGERTHVLEARREESGARLMWSSREVPGGLLPPVTAGWVGGQALGLSLGSGEVLSVGPTGATSRRVELMWPAPRRGATLILGLGPADSTGFPVRSWVGASSGDRGLWLMGGERMSDGAALTDLWVWPLPGLALAERERDLGPSWMRVSEGTGWGGEARFATAPRGLSGGSGTFWAARPSPSGVLLARLTPFAQVRWQELAATGVGPTAVSALAVLEDGTESLVVVLAPGGSGLTAHLARVDDSGPLAPTATWGLVGDWAGATEVLAFGPAVPHVPADPARGALGVAARVGDAVEVRRLDRTGFSPAVRLAAIGPAGPAMSGSELGVWSQAVDRGYLIGEGGVWVMDADDQALWWRAIAGLRPGATALGEDAALWHVSQGHFLRVPLECE